MMIRACGEIARSEYGKWIPMQMLCYYVVLEEFLSMEKCWVYFQYYFNFV